MEGLIFKPNKKRLLEARNKRLERWEHLENITYTEEQRIERINADIEVFESMKLVRERAMKCIEMIKK